MKEFNLRARWQHWRRPWLQPGEVYIGTCRCCGHPLTLGSDSDSGVLYLGCRNDQPAARAGCVTRHHCTEWAGRCRGWHLSRWQYRRMATRLLRALRQGIRASLREFGDCVVVHNSREVRDWLARQRAKQKVVVERQDYGYRTLPNLYAWEGQVAAVAGAGHEVRAFAVLAAALAAHLFFDDPYDLEDDHDSAASIVELDDDGTPILDECRRFLYAFQWDIFAEALARGWSVDDLA